MKRFLKNKFKNIELRWARTSPKRYIDFLRFKGVKIGDNVTFYNKINTISIDITRPSLVEIGNNVAINKNFLLITHDWASRVFLYKYNTLINSSGRVIIGNNVSFGMNCTVLKGVTIGDNCFIGLGSIVTTNIPSNSVAIGAPAKVICTLDEYFKKRKEHCVEEAFDYARSIKERFKRKPKIDEFWEEFPLFLDGDKNNPQLPIKKQMGNAFEHYQKNHKSKFNGFDDFLKQAGV